jgi:hypothetical protein
VKLTASILLIFCIYANSNAQNAWKEQWLKPDKADHLIASVWLTVAATEGARMVKFKNPELMGAGIALLVGGLKEFLYDKQPSAYDLGANFVGVSIAIPVYKIIKLTDKPRRKIKI